MTNVVDFTADATTVFVQDMISGTVYYRYLSMLHILFRFTNERNKCNK